MPITTIAPAGNDTDTAPNNENYNSIATTACLWIQRHIFLLGGLLLLLLVGTGIMARNGWFPRTDGLSGKRTGWFGREIPKSAPSSWNPFAMPTATPTPQLSKEYVYAGSRLLAVEDENASAVPPADLAVWRGSDGTWYVLGGPGSQQTQYQFGQAGDKPAPGDFDGDGKTDFAVFRTSGTPTWFIAYSTGSTLYMAYGASTDLPVPADYDGDGKSDIAVYRPSNGAWYIFQSSTQSTVAHTVGGNSGDTPAPADYDGDGKADPGVWRDASTCQFIIKRSTDGASQTVNIGSSGDFPVPGDYDGDGKANYAVLHGNDWIIMNAALTAIDTTSWQTSGDTPVQNDYDGDGKVDIACWHLDNKDQGHWYIRQSSDSSTRHEQWGILDDIPVPAYFRR